jgi:hypothetical protein
MRVINFLFAKNHKKHSSLTKTVGALLLCVTLISTWTFPQKAEAAVTNTFGDGITVQLPDVSLDTIFSDGALINGTIIVDVPSIDSDGDGSIAVSDVDEQKSWSAVEMTTEATQANGFTLTGSIFLMIKQGDSSSTVDTGSLYDLTPKMTQATNTFTKQVSGLIGGETYYARIVAPKVDSYPIYYVSNYVTFTTKTDGSTVASAVLQNNQDQVQKGVPGSLPDCWTWGSGMNIMGCVANLVYFGIYYPSQWLAKLGGYFLDFFMSYSISSDAYTASSFPEKGWAMLRDLANICFIFLIVYTGIKLILTIDSASAKKTLTNIIIVAILINFSLFFTKVVIDTGNVLARVFYNSIKVENQATGNPNVGIAGEKAISVTLVEQIDPQKIMSTDVGTGDDGYPLDPSTHAGVFVLVTLLAAAVNIYFMYIFFSVGFLFVGRLLQLWISMITSPIACIAYAAKGNTGYFKEWFDDLWKSSMVAPIFIFFLYLIASFLKAGLVTGLFSNYNDKGVVAVLMTVAIPFVLLMGLLKKAMDMAQEYSSKTGKLVTEKLNKAGKVVGGLAVGAATGGAALMGSRSFGMIAKKAMTEERMERLNKASAAGGMRGFIADRKINVLKKTAESSFDIRNTKLASTVQEKSGFKFNDKLLSSVNLSTANTKDGYKGEVDRKQKKHIEKAKDLKTSFKKDDDVKKYYEEENKKYTKKRDTFLASKSPQGKPALLNSIQLQQIEAEFEKKNGKKPPELKTRDEATNHLREEYIKSLEKGNLYSQVSQKLGAIGTQDAALGGIDGALFGGIAGSAAMAGAGAGVASFVGGSQATRDAEQGAISEIKKLIKTDSKLAEKEALLKEKTDQLEGKSAVPVATQQTNLKREIAQLDVELGQLNQTIKHQQDVLFAFSQNLAKESVGKSDDDVIIVKIDGKDVSGKVSEHRANEKAQEETLITKTASKNDKISAKTEKEGELKGLNNLKADKEKLEKEIEGMKNKGKKGGDGGGAKKKE